MSLDESPEIFPVASADSIPCCNTVCRDALNGAVTKRPRATLQIGWFSSASLKSRAIVEAFFNKSSGTYCPCEVLRNVDPQHTKELKTPFTSCPPMVRKVRSILSSLVFLMLSVR